jgi:DNA-binding transcriptional LysR family regulator
MKRDYTRLKIPELMRFLELAKQLDGRKPLQDIHRKASDDLNKLSIKIFGQTRVLVYAPQGQKKAGAKLTAEGQRLYRYATMTLDVLRRYQNDPQKQERVLRLSCMPAIAALDLPWMFAPVLQGTYFQQCYIDHKNYLDAALDVSIGIADLGFGAMIETGLPPNVRQQLLFTTSRCLIARRDLLVRAGPETPKVSGDLGRLPLVSYWPDRAAKDGLQDLMPSQEQLHEGVCHVYVNSNHVIREWVRRGLAAGTGYTHDYWIDEDVVALRDYASGDLGEMTKSIYLYSVLPEARGDIPQYQNPKWVSALDTLIEGIKRQAHEFRGLKSAKNRPAGTEA